VQSDPIGLAAAYSGNEDGSGPKVPWEDGKYPFPDKAKKCYRTRDKGDKPSRWGPEHECDCKTGDLLVDKRKKESEQKGKDEVKQSEKNSREDPTNHGQPYPADKGSSSQSGENSNNNGNGENGSAGEDLNKKGPGYPFGAGPDSIK
jgi:hypothetical protein